MDIPGYVYQLRLAEHWFDGIDTPRYTIYANKLSYNGFYMSNNWVCYAAVNAWRNGFDAHEMQLRGNVA